MWIQSSLSLSIFIIKNIPLWITAKLLVAISNVHISPNHHKEDIYKLQMTNHCTVMAWFITCKYNYNFLTLFSVFHATRFHNHSKSCITYIMLNLSLCFILQHVKGHQFQECHFYNTALCHHCDGLLWGIGNQGYQCQCKTSI